jgi:hypothetical protein
MIFSLRACSTVVASDKGVEQALNLCLNGQLYRRADALIADAALILCLNGQLYRRADAFIADAA